MDSFSNYYDLLSHAFNGDNSTARLQAFVNTLFANKYNVLNIDGFKFAQDMQLDFTYEQLQKEIGITAMANYYDVDSPAVPRGAEGISLLTGKIPRMKDVIYFDEDKVRKQLIIERMYGSNSDKATNSALRKLFGTMDDLVAGHTNSLTYQRHQMVSNKKLTLTDSNNPKGLVGVTFSAGVPNANSDSLPGNARFWTDKGIYATEGSSSDPIKSIADWLDPILDKAVPGHLEINSPYLRRILRHSKVLSTIGLSLFPALETSVSSQSVAVMSEDTRRSALENILGIMIKPIDSKCAVEKYDKPTKSLIKTNVNAFESDVIVFVPDGTIGEFLTAMPIKFQSANATTAEFYGGRLLVTVEADAVKKCQGFYSEMTTLAVPEVPQYLHYLYPNN